MAIGLIILGLGLITIFILFGTKTPEYTDKELFNKFGSTYLDSIKRNSDKKDIQIANYKKRLDNLQNKIDTCVLVFEEYFAQDQTNDDLLVLAFEQLHNISDIKTDGFYVDNDVRKILRKGLRIIESEMGKIRYNQTP
jgi:hypothetical protein